jgi:high-affinity iron transporter
MPRILVLVGLLASASLSGAGEVRGRVEMPDACSPSASPAVVTLEPLDGSTAPLASKPPAKVALVNQHGLQFEPRIQVVAVGQTIRFTNQDAETHNVHILTPGFPFNKSMAPNRPEDFVPQQAGVIRLVCDIHSHMRGYVVATSSPFAKVCKGGSAFTFPEVPAGRYALVAWHEMGEPYRREVEVPADGVDLGVLSLKGFAVSAMALAKVPARKWSEVTDRIGLLLAEAREVAVKPEGLGKARRLAEDAYWGEFELSDMETAIRRHLGGRRASSVESAFLSFRKELKSLAETKDAAPAIREARVLLIELARASDELNRMGIADRTAVGAASVAAESVAVPEQAERARQLEALGTAFAEIQAIADRGQASDASSAMTDAYFTAFEPLERFLNVTRPGEVPALEADFNGLRGRIDSGMKGEALAADLAGLRGSIVAALDRSETSKAGSFGLAFANSLVTAVREGVEVILLLTMLVALVAKTGQRRALAAIAWGVAAAVLASVATAVGLNSLVASAQGRTREMVEGGVLLAAAGVLFYVSYWLISQSQAKRWSDFLKSQVARGAKLGGLGTLAITAFLAVYREGAETALLYQGLIVGQGGSRAGLLGLVAGLAVGVVILAGVAIAIRLTSVRLPLRSFFKVTGLALFAMAVVFAGNGVFELQGAGIIKVTPVGWLGAGLPALGIHPSVQPLSVQGLLLLGAALAVILPRLDGPRKPVEPAKVEATVSERN